MPSSPPPPGSPDRNLIESILAHVMREFSHNHPRTVREPQLRSTRFKIKIPKDILEQLYDEMIRRVDVMMRAK